MNEHRWTKKTAGTGYPTCGSHWIRVKPLHKYLLGRPRRPAIGQRAGVRTGMTLSPCLRQRGNGVALLDMTDADNGPPQDSREVTSGQRGAARGEEWTEEKWPCLAYTRVQTH